MKFYYNASTIDGKIKKGIIEAPSETAAITLLKNRDLIVTDLEEMKVKTTKKFSWYRISLVERIFLAKNLATMLKSGVSILEALEVIKNEKRSYQFRKIINRIYDQVESGQSLTQSFSMHSRAFDPLFINLIKIGEASGTLEKSLNYLSEEIEKKLSLKKKIKSALMYPAIIVMVTAVLGFILAYFIIPKIVPLFRSLNVDLPLATKILIRIGELLQNYGLMMFGGFIFSVIAFRIILSLKFIKPAWHWLLIRTPIIGNFIRQYNLANLCRTLGILIKSGLPLLDALNVTNDTLTNYNYKREIKLLIREVTKGKSIYNVLKKRNQRVIFPSIMLSLIRVGEESGRLDETLLYLGEHYEREVDNISKNLSTLIEPILLIIIGLVVAFVAASIIMPIYKFSGSIKTR